MEAEEEKGISLFYLILSRSHTVFRDHLKFYFKLCMFSAPEFSFADYTVYTSV